MLQSQVRRFKPRRPHSSLPSRADPWTAPPSGVDVKQPGAAAAHSAPAASYSGVESPRRGGTKGGTREGR